MSRYIIKNEDLVPPDKTNEEKKREDEEKLRDIYINSDYPNTMENGSATLLWILVLVVGSIFNGGWAIWIISTIIWWRFINRKEIRAKEWDEKHNK